ncbi:MAG: hypothetical protein M1457_12865 [bacterium]|nr:hypothetical protein [bacterium]
MIEQVQQLEGRVENLLRLLDKARQVNGQLRQENQALRDKLAELEGVKAENGQLNTQIRQLESEMEGMAGRESQIRERLRTILGKIDSIESEINSGDGSEKML